jgi:hypothetical protein
MTTPAEGAAAAAPAEGAAVTLTPAEQTSVEVGQRGFTEPTGVNTPAPSGPQRPDYIPEKFWKDGKADLEGLAKSYSELERARSAAAPEAAAAPAAAEAPAATTDASGKITPPAKTEPVANPLNDAMELARTEWTSGQTVSDETVAKLEAAGIPKEVFGLYLEGLKAQTAQLLSTIHGFVGGEDTYNEMAQWAGQNLGEAELNAFNTALDNPEMRENAVRGLHARYAAARPSEGNLLTPAGTPSQAGDVYTTRDQLVADQRNPLYATDAGFRDNVVQKLIRSQKSGFQVVARPMFEREIHTR